MLKILHERKKALKKTELVHMKEIHCTVLMRKAQEFSATIKSDLIEIL